VRNKPWPRPFAWFAVITSSVLLALALVNLIINTTSVRSWLPLMVLMPLGLFRGLRDLRRSDDQ
jgi:hypothetical protein